MQMMSKLWCVPSVEVDPIFVEPDNRVILDVDYINIGSIESFEIAVFHIRSRIFVVFAHALLSELPIGYATVV